MSVETTIETIVRLPSILVLHVSRALELQIGLYTELAKLAKLTELVKLAELCIGLL